MNRRFNKTFALHLLQKDIGFADLIAETQQQGRYYMLYNSCMLKPIDKQQSTSIFQRLFKCLSNQVLLN
jgi:3-hydroxyisobutyrate dehydrogenase